VQIAPGVLRLALGAYFFWRALNLPDTTSESRRDGVKAPGRQSWVHIGPKSKESAGTAEGCVRSIQPSLAGLDSFVSPTQDGRPGLYIHAVPSGLLRAPGEVSSLTADGPR